MHVIPARYLVNGLAASVLLVLGGLYIKSNPLHTPRPDVAILNEDGLIGAANSPSPATPALDLAAKEAQASTSLAAESLAKRKADAEILPMVHTPPPTVSIAEHKSLAGAPVAVAPAKARGLEVDGAAAKTAEGFRDRFATFTENTMTSVSTSAVSTFSIDVDTAAYSFVRRQLNNGYLPAKDAVRLEEMVNYFPYEYPLPESKQAPFKPSITVMDSPFTQGNKLVHIGIKGYQNPPNKAQRTNLVFLLDVSGSMDAPDKLPLVRQSMGVLLDSLKAEDTVAIAVYAGAAGTVLPPTQVKEKTKILAALNNLHAGGATAGAEGIDLAYRLAEENFNPKGVNRIILATDGDFNVGPTGDKDLKDYVERKREKGIYLSVLGFGQGNYQDAMMQTLAQNGNGVAAYIDTLSEAQKVLVDEATASLFPIANDVKIQMEFNPATVAQYRLLGYETRALKREDFTNDKVDAGEIGAGHSVTAIYEITPVAKADHKLEESRYTVAPSTKKTKTDEYGFLRMRYKIPGEAASQLIETPVLIDAKPNPTLQQEASFATAVAAFSQILRGSAYSGAINFDTIIELAQKNKGPDEYGYRTEFIQLVRKAKTAKAL